MVADEMAFGLDLVALERIQNQARGRIIGAVIKSQGDDFLAHGHKVNCLTGISRRFEGGRLALTAKQSWPSQQQANSPCRK